MVAIEELLAELSGRRRFGMRPGLENMQRAMAALDHPEARLGLTVHIAGTNGKGAVAALLEAFARAAGLSTARYISPHLVRINERFALNGVDVDDSTLAGWTRLAASAFAAVPDCTYFEALTIVAFAGFAAARPQFTVLETGLGGRLDATNVCRSDLCVITRIGLDHCEWLGGTEELIAAEKAGIAKRDVPIVLGRNRTSVRALVERHANLQGAPFLYAPDLVAEDEASPAGGCALAGAFNRENMQTACAAMRVLAGLLGLEPAAATAAWSRALREVRWPGRYQRCGNVLVDGAHNPPAARALAASLAGEIAPGTRPLVLVVACCGDKDIDATLAELSPFAARAVATRTGNPRALPPAELADRCRRAGIPAATAPTVADALAIAGADPAADATGAPAVLACGSLFLAGEALAALGVIDAPRLDCAEQLVPSPV